MHQGDLDDTEGLLRIIEKVQPRYVVHLAAISFVAHGDADEIYRVNLMGTRRLLAALSRAKVKPEAVLLASSANIYGNNAQVECLTEDTPPAPANDYAVSKLAMEYVAGLYREQLPLIIARPFNYTGVGQAPSFLLPKIVGHFQRKAPVIELGNLDVARDFSDVRVVAEVYRRLLETPASIGGTFNVCSGCAYTLQQVLQMARDISRHDLEVRINPAFVRANEVKTLTGSSDRLAAVLGQLPRMELEQTLRWMLGDLPAGGRGPCAGEPG
jgi:nucleoside-diphosphate-sugar epimerase